MTEKTTTKPSAPIPLSARESEVMALAAQGLLDKEIATRMGVSTSSVRTYWDRMRAKLGAANRAHAIALGMPHNLIDKVDEEIGHLVLGNIEDEAISICDKRGTFRTWNKGVKTILGYDKEEWIGQHSSIIFIPEEKGEATVELDDADKAGASVNERWHLHKDGNHFWGVNTVIPLEASSTQGAYIKIVRPKPAPGS